MRRLTQLIVILVGTVLLGGGSGCERGVELEEGAAASVLDLGIVYIDKVGMNARFRLAITNSDEVARITSSSVRTSCGCVSVRLEPSEIAPGQAGMIHGDIRVDQEGEFQEIVWVTIGDRVHKTLIHGNARIDESLRVFVVGRSGAEAELHVLLERSRLAGVPSKDIRVRTGGRELPSNTGEWTLLMTESSATRDMALWLKQLRVRIPSSGVPVCGSTEWNVFLEDVLRGSVHVWFQPGERV